MSKELPVQKRSNALLLIGVVAFLIGTALVLSVTRAGERQSAAAPEAAVLVARQALPAGTELDAALAAELVEVREVAADTRAPDALADTTGLRGRVLAADVPAEGQLRASHLRPATLRATEALVIPAGKQGVALQLPFVAGGAGYVGTGDRVNVYGNVDHPHEGKVTKLVLADVEVLDVSTEVAPRRNATEEERPAGGAVTYLLALDADQAERVIYLAANAQVWLTLAGDDAQPVPPTAGRRATDVLS